MLCNTCHREFLVEDMLPGWKTYPAKDIKKPDYYQCHECGLKEGVKRRYAVFRAKLLEDGKKRLPSVTELDIVRAYRLFFVIKESFEWEERGQFWEMLLSENPLK